VRREGTALWLSAMMGNSHCAIDGAGWTYTKAHRYR
jgi:hypothetical protein